MLEARMSIAELAEAAGLSRRAVRYYVQMKLLPPPLGVGRGNHYDASHLQRLKRIAELTAAGYSLESVRKILDGAAREADLPPPRRTAGISAPLELWTRIKLADGLEIHFDPRRHALRADQLARLRDAVQGVLQNDR